MLTFDRSSYFLIPRTPAWRKLAVGRLMVANQAQDLGANVDRHAKSLASDVELLESAFTTRHIEASAVTPKEDVELDNFTDVLWGIGRDRLDHWAAFVMPAPTRFASAGAGGSFDYAAHQAKATEVAKARQLLLASGGVAFTRLKFTEQAEHMRTLWRLIEDEELEPLLGEAMGADFFGALRDAHGRYLEMIERRLAHAQGSEVSIRQRAAALDRSMQMYVLALLVALDESDTAKVETVRKALRPIDALRVQLARERSATTGLPEGVEGQVADEAVAELLAEEEAVVAEIDAMSEGEPSEG